MLKYLLVAAFLAYCVWYIRNAVNDHAARLGAMSEEEKNEEFWDKQI